MKTLLYFLLLLLTAASGLLAWAAGYLWVLGVAAGLGALWGIASSMAKTSVAPSTGRPVLLTTAVGIGAVAFFLVWEYAHKKPEPPPLPPALLGEDLPALLARYNGVAAMLNTSLMIPSAEVLVREPINERKMRFSHNITRYTRFIIEVDTTTRRPVAIGVLGGLDGTTEASVAVMESVAALAATAYGPKTAGVDAFVKLCGKPADTTPHERIGGMDARCAVGGGLIVAGIGTDG